MQQGGLDMRTVESLLKGGKSGPAIVPGKPAESLLLKRVLSKDMPPPRELINAGVRPLEVNEIDLLTKWVAQGAKRFDI
ncbi:MAG: c-type cytochrome domain-containing protein, partial [Pirellulaceae bacterium]|nr:c-type cytochrome domain-containing protein [Pirellulaceae bacterium]